MTEPSTGWLMPVKSPWIALTVAALYLSSPLRFSEPTLLSASAPLVPTSERGRVRADADAAEGGARSERVDQAVEPAHAAGLGGQAAEVAGVGRGLEVAARQARVADAPG